MAKALDQPPGRMTVDEFLAWAMAQPEGRFELVDGRVVAMAPERAGMRASRHGSGVPWTIRLEIAICPVRRCRTA